MKLHKIFIGVKIRIKQTKTSSENVFVSKLKAVDDRFFTLATVKIVKNSITAHA